MEKRQEIYELQDVPNPSCGSEPHASLTAAKWSRLTYTNTDPPSNDYEQHDAKTRERLALEIYTQARLASEWLKQKNGERRLAALSRQTGPNVVWIWAIAMMAVLSGGVLVLLH
jgi:hypothetical protein